MSCRTNTNQTYLESYNGSFIRNDFFTSGGEDIIKSKIKRAHEGWLFLCLKIKLIFKSNI